MSGLVLGGRYELQQLVSDGSIFNVWSAIDRIGPRDVSIRLLNSPFHLETEFHQALRQVIEETKSIKHPNIERITDIEVDDERVFLVGEPVRGMSLVDRIKKLAPFSTPVAVGTAITICEGLGAIHRAGVVHGDVGSHNVRVLPEGSAIVQQTSLWRAYSASRTAGPTVLPQMAAHLAPEVSQGEMPSLASDVYGVGVLLFQLLTGRTPYQADQPVAMAMKHVNEPTPAVRDFNPAVPIALDEVVKKALAKDRAHRYANAIDLLSDLRIIQDAIRFGRSLAWPLPPKSDVEAPPPSSTEDAVEQGREVKKVSTPSKSVKPKVPNTYDPSTDVPNWLKGVLVFFVSLVAMMVGAWMIFNFKKPKLVTTPDLHRLSVAKAQSQLEPMKLKLRITKRVFDEQVPADTILDMDPTPGERIYEGGVINVKVSMGSRFVEVPDLRGMTVDKAKLLLDSLELKLDENIVEERAKDVEKGMIIKQLPESRNRVERSTVIRIVVSSGRTAPTPTKSDDSKYLYTVTIELNDITESVLMRVDMTDNRSTRTISEERREPGEVVELTAEGYGPQAIFKIFYDGEPITQVTKRADGEQPE